MMLTLITLLALLAITLAWAYPLLRELRKAYLNQRWLRGERRRRYEELDRVRPGPDYVNARIDQMYSADNRKWLFHSYPIWRDLPADRNGFKISFRLFIAMLLFASKHPESNPNWVFRNDIRREKGFFLRSLYATNPTVSV